MGVEQRKWVPRQKKWMPRQKIVLLGHRRTDQIFREVAQIFIVAAMDFREQAKASGEERRDCTPGPPYPPPSLPPFGTGSLGGNGLIREIL